MVVSLVVCFTVLLLAYRAESFIDRLVQIKERAFDAQKSTEASGPGAVGSSKLVIPDDLEALAMTESETWAQEDVRGIIRERYAQLKDWNKVRIAVGIGEMP